MAACEFIETEPQIKAPRVAPLEGASTYAPAGAYVSMHCGGHDADERRLIVLDYPQPSKKYKQPQCLDSKLQALRRREAPRRSTRMTWIKRMFSYPCKSAPSAKSAFYRSDSRTRSTDWKVSGFICVHPRFFYDVTFQTGWTGWTGYDFNSINNFEELGE